MVVPTLKNSLKIKNGKFIKINYEINNNIISKIKYTGDFFLYPEESLIDLERLLTGKKFEYDIYYVDNRNFLLDLKVLFITLLQVLRGKGINPENHEIMHSR